MRERLVVLIATLGVGVALLSGLSQHLDWVANLCGWFGQGCHDTSKFFVLGVPVWVLGVAFYLGVIGTTLFFARGIFWLIVSGMGMEVAFVWVMFSEKVICVFCLVNLVLMVILFLLALERNRVWQTLAMVSMLLLVGMGVVAKEELPHSKVVETPPAVAANAPDESIVAKIGDRRITREELEKPLLMRLHEYDVQAYRLKRERLEQMIAEIVLRNEAARLGIPLQQLLDELVTPQSLEVSAEEVERFHHDNPHVRTNWKGSAEELENYVKGNIRQRKSYQIVMDKAHSLYAQEGVVISLREPEEPRVQVNIGDAVTRGADNATVTIVEFSDYQCPACRKNHGVMKTVLESYKDQVKWIFKDFPLRSHRWGVQAAVAARCAGDQRRFAAYQDTLFGSSEELTPEQLQTYAVDMGLDGDQFKACIDSGKYQAGVEKSIADGASIGVTSTPTLVINGRMTVGGQSVESLKKLIDEELAKQGRKSE